MLNDLVVLIPANGVGRRFGAGVPKQHIDVLGQSVLQHTLDLFTTIKLDSKVVLIGQIDSSSLNANQLVFENIPGGKSRFHSVSNGIRQVCKIPNNSWILVHDAVRCCLHPSDLFHLISELQAHPVGGLLAEPITNTVKQMDASSEVVKTLPRERLAAAQTPQLFRKEVLVKAMEYCISHGIEATDEAMMVEQLGLKPKIVFAKHPNPKLTHPSDLAFVEHCLVRRNISDPALRCQA